MTNLPAKLQQLLQSKADIKAALESRGIDMTDVAFNEYYAKIRLLAHIDNKYTISKIRPFDGSAEPIILPS
jgi:lambda repressor-like predicted transcriptional regulator